MSELVPRPCPDCGEETAQLAPLQLHSEPTRYQCSNGHTFMKRDLYE